MAQSRALKGHSEEDDFHTKGLFLPFQNSSDLHNRALHGVSTTNSVSWLNVPPWPSVAQVCAW